MPRGGPEQMTARTSAMISRCARCCTAVGQPRRVERHPHLAARARRRSGEQRLEHPQGRGDHLVVSPSRAVDPGHRALDPCGPVTPLHPAQVLGGERCQVGRSTWVRTQPPAACSASTSAYVVPGLIRMPSDHAASGASWACTQPSSRTTSRPVPQAGRRRVAGWPVAGGARGRGGGQAPAILAPATDAVGRHRHGRCDGTRRPAAKAARAHRTRVGRTADTGIDRPGTPGTPVGPSRRDLL